jgi:hypothetical protein
VCTLEKTAAPLFVTAFWSVLIKALVVFIVVADSVPVPALNISLLLAFGDNSPEVPVQNIKLKFPNV